MAQPMMGQRREFFGKLDHWLMSEACEHDMFELFQLGRYRRVDAGIGVAEKIYPPGTDGVQVAVALGIVQPCTLAANDGNQRQLFMQFHLRAGVPHGLAAALQKILIAHAAACCRLARECSVWRSRSMSSMPWAADREIRSRAVPAGTVGGRIAGTQIPC